MKPDQEKHLQWIKDQFCRMIDTKYRNGAKEHKGRLWHEDCLREAILEALDLIAYLFTEAMCREADKPDTVVPPIYKRSYVPDLELASKSRGQKNKVRGAGRADSAQARTTAKRKGAIRAESRRGRTECS
jgi:hypothetical protein